MSKKICAVCGEPISKLEAQLVAQDVDFVQHGRRHHLIRLVEQGAEEIATEIIEDVDKHR